MPPLPLGAHARRAACVSEHRLHLPPYRRLPPPGCDIYPAAQTDFRRLVEPFSPSCTLCRFGYRMNTAAAGSVILRRNSACRSFFSPFHAVRVSLEPQTLLPPARLPLLVLEHFSALYFCVPALPFCCHHCFLCKFRYDFDFSAFVRFRYLGSLVTSFLLSHAVVSNQHTARYRSAVSTVSLTYRLGTVRCKNLRPGCISAFFPAFVFILRTVSF